MTEDIPMLEQYDNSFRDMQYVGGHFAGFGGGGSNGKRSLEGTFLPGCIMTARAAARSINAGG